MSHGSVGAARYNPWLCHAWGSRRNRRIMEHVRLSGSYAWDPCMAICVPDSPQQESLWLCLDVPGGDATNNAAERVHQCGVMWRKRSQGTCHEKGKRWVERVLSFRRTCRISEISDGSPITSRYGRMLSHIQLPELTFF